MTEQSIEATWQTGLIGGVEKRDIVLSTYRPEWPAQFDRHKSIVAEALGARALGIEHIGSTAVPGLAAKPIVDMLLIVAESGEEASYLPELQACGYQLRVRKPEFEQHRMLRTAERDVHLHVFSEGASEIERYLRFRDRLRSSPRDRQRYQDLKQRLAAQDWADMNAYADAKADLIESILATAGRKEKS